MSKRPLHYFKNATEWRTWLHENYANSEGVELIFYKVDSEEESMRWEEAVQVAICYGWIDSTVRKIDDKRRKQYFCKRNPNSGWSAINKDYVTQLTEAGFMHSSGLEAIETAKQNGSWSLLDDVENGVIPDDLREAFDKNPEALYNYNSFAKGYRKNYLYWLNQAKREETRQKRVEEIVMLCAQNKKQRG
ncbi:YdeI/OmpD-associated family protein [Leeuwenhoekiella parthenopeia]|uniref:YdeI/OmpD-associated family protein n=1 Tax=Leeuwenhoekiella parthenopeia TaxID=2890320 RepID=A0ABS8GPB6_9FLAO|nr:YdeI/OmpD-associated family protein [Leeuwenhoekiella parthenopeia]MCC4211132.1 YdeI/OmpD-associated family protein [Leeuwenhoekiella parthenopeia]